MIQGIIIIMHDVIDKRVVYDPNGKCETIVHTAKLPEKIASGLDGYDFAYDYNYDMTEDDSYYEPNTHSNNDNTTLINTIPVRKAI
jgi:hypothetical protein